MRGMLKLTLFLVCSALAAFGADDPWAKVKAIKSGSELRVYKKGAAQPLLVKMDEATDDRLASTDGRNKIKPQMNADEHG